MDTNILIVQNSVNKNCLYGLTLTDEAKDKDLAEFINQNAVKLPKMTKNAWFIGNDAEQKLKEKIESIGRPLKDWNVNLNYGIKTGLNEAFVIGTATKEQLCQEDPKNREILKPILRGRNIHKYVYEWAGLWLIFIPWHFPLHEDQSIQGSSQKAENEFIKQYPSMHAHLLQFKEYLLKRNLAETGIRYEWYALQRCAATYYNEFEKEKLIWQEICQESSFSYDNNGVFCNDTGRILTGSYIKYLLGFFNTKFFQITYSRYYAGGALGEKAIRFKSEFMKDYPIPSVTAQNLPIVKMIESIVAHIIDDKQRNFTTNTSALEAKIERLVYQLYELTPEEIKIIEGKI